MQFSGEQIGLENNSRSKYKQRWGEVIVSDFYSNERVNDRVREVFERGKFSPFHRIWPLLTFPISITQKRNQSLHTHTPATANHFSCPPKCITPTWLNVVVANANPEFIWLIVWKSVVKAVWTRTNPSPRSNFHRFR